MSLADLLKKPIQRLNPHRGLAIDVATWSAAHDYHRLHRQLHTLSMHRPGVVTGLDVVAWSPPDNSVVVYPGVAVDSEGNVIMVAEPLRLQLQVQEAGSALLVLQYREVSQGSDEATAGDDSQAAYILEGYTLEERRQVPNDVSVELARVSISGTSSTVSDAPEMGDPGPDQIDLRYRKDSGPRSMGEISVGVVPLEATASGEVLHLSGALSLVQAINSHTGYQAELKGTVNLNEDISGISLLLMAGHQEFDVTEDWQNVLLNFLGRGGVLLGEPCSSGNVGGGDSNPFSQSFITLVRQLNRELVLVERDHPLLTTPYRFGQPPEGSNGPSRLMAGDGIVFSDGDFGCLWGGGGPGEPATRSSIRSAMEIGTNMGIYSYRRTHLRSVKMATG